MRAIGMAVSLGRIAVGGALAVAPGLAGGWIGRDARRPGTQTMVRAFAARDFGLGAGALTALATGRPARLWMAAALVSDATDFAATLLARDKLPDQGATIALGLAGSGTVLGVVYLLFGERDEDLLEPPSSAA